MPILSLKICSRPSPEVSARVAKILTDLTVEVLKKKRDLTAVAIEYGAPTEWFIGGRDIGTQPAATFHLDIKVTEGTNTKDEKALYISRAFAAVESVLGPLAPASYIVVHDVRADSWGYQGETQEARYVRSKSL